VTRCFTLGCVLGMATMGWWLTVPVSGQAGPSAAATRAKTAETRAVPRTADGKPDLQGMWTNDMSTHAFEGPRERDLKKGIKAAPGVFFHDFGKPERLSFRGGLVDPPDGKLPLQPWASAKRDEIIRNSDDPKGNLEYVDPRARCFLPGVPFSNYATPYNGYQIVQAPGRVLIISEWNHTYRSIPLDGRPHVGERIRLWMGDSRGRWEGDTLVVDVRNFNDKTWLSGGGEFHSESLHVVERFTMVGPNTINYEATIEDPKVFTRPWTLAFTFDRAEKGYELFEYACHEGNRAPDLILKR
jgi:hypothetical protein